MSVISDLRAEVREIRAALGREMRDRGAAEQERDQAVEAAHWNSTRVGDLILERDTLRSALIYLADGIADEVQPHQDSTLADHVRNARAALRGHPVPPAGRLAEGVLAPTDLTDGKPT